MGQFDHIKKKTETSETVRFEMPEIGRDCYLIVAQATESNRPFFNALLRFQNAHRRGFRQARQGQLNADQMDQELSRDLSLYREHIVKGWGGINDGDGNPVEFTKEDCRDLFEAIPNSLFNEIRVFCQQPMNFLTAAAADYTGTAKN